MSTNRQIIYVDNDTLLKITDLYNEDLGAYVNDATVTVTIKDRQGVDVSGIAWPQAMVYVSGSNGEYKVTLDKVLGIVDAAGYIAYVDITTPGGNDAHFECDLAAETRKSVSS